MKNYIVKGLLGLSVLVAMPSCMDTLDTHPTAEFNEETVWGSKATADAFVQQVYANILGTGYTGSGSSVAWEARTPNCTRSSRVGEGIDNYAVETADLSATPSFAHYRRVNMIFKQVEESSSLGEADKEDLLANAHFLRGLLYFQYARMHGRILPIEQVFEADDSLSCRVAFTENVEESYKLVVKELELGVQGLPETSAAGLPNKYAAEVILSRACLQAYAYTKDKSYLEKAVTAAKDVVANNTLTTDYADMFNNPTSTNSEILWAQYWLNTNTTCNSFSEMQQCAPNISLDDVATTNSPVQWNTRYFEAWGIFWPTQDLVDQYLVTDEATGEALPWNETSQWKNNVDEKDGATLTEVGQVEKWDRTNGTINQIPEVGDFDQLNSRFPAVRNYYQLKAGATKNLSQLMYQNRDKRFDANIVYDGCNWGAAAIETNLGGNASMGVRDQRDGGWYNTTTNYYWRKGMPNDIDHWFHQTKTDYHQCIARVGEAYLNLAEAYLLQGKVSEAVAALNATRTTHGGIAASKATTEEQAWADYIRERNCEMTNEGGDLYYSYLRWGKIGGYANHGEVAGGVVYDLNRPVYKVEINSKRDALVINQLTILNSAARQFTAPKRYLMGISQSFLDTRAAYGLDHQQNDGY